MDSPAGDGRADQPTDGLAGSVARLRRALRRAARAADPANQLAVAQLELLSVLAEHPGARPGQLARLLRLRPNTVTTIVNSLTGLGMVERGPSGPDRRAVALHLTDAGAHAVRSWQATNEAVLDHGIAALPAHQRRALERAVPALDALVAAIDRLADTTGTDAT